MSSAMRGALPLLAAQSAVWRAQQVGGVPSERYNFAQFVELRGQLDVGLLEEAIRITIGSAEALHVQVFEHDSGLFQIVDPAKHWFLTVTDFGGTPSPDVAADNWISDNLERPVSDTEGLFEFSLLRLGPDWHRYYQRCHHLAVDAFGSALLMRRVAELYNALVQRQPLPGSMFGSLTQLVSEESLYSSSETSRLDREFWLDNLSVSGAAARLTPAVTSMALRSARTTVVVDREGAQAVRNVARLARSAWPACMVAVAAVYAYRSTGARQISLGMPVTCRATPLARRTPAMLANIVPLQLSIDPAASFEEFVASVSRQMRDILRHQRYRHELLAHDLGLPLLSSDLFGPQVNVLTVDEQLRFGDCAGQIRGLVGGPVDDLRITAYGTSSGEGLVIDLDLGTDAESAGLAANIEDRYCRVLRDTTGRPHRPIGSTRLLSGERASECLSPGEVRPAQGLAEMTVPEVFEAQVERHPDAAAVECGEEALSYFELNQRANRLAARLIAFGIGGEQVVALMLPRTSEIVVALLAVLKAGAAYMPVTSDQPQSRVAYMLADSAAALLITDAETPATRSLNCPVMFLNDGESDEEDLPSGDTRNRRSIWPLNACYLMYTSGSTGLPKAVVTTHRGVVNLASAQVAASKVQTGSRVAQLAPFGFDVASGEVLVSLLTGATVVMPPRDVILGDSDLLEFLVSRKISHAIITPSLLSSVPVPAEPPEHLTLLVGGEPCPPELAARWARDHSLINAYGSTETTVCTTMSAPLQVTGGTPIGGPLGNTGAYVLDDCLQPVNQGVAGELYLTGAGLARGYWRRAALTASQFVADPFGPPGSRMYRTGDVARWLVDGQLEFVGRTDEQMSIHGFRIEPGEIEAVIRQHERVATSVVTARRGSNSRDRLVAYVVPASGVEVPPSADLRAYLESRLPRYMVPADFVVLQSLPLTATGKVDKRALPAPTAAQGVVESASSVKESRLCDLYAEVLNLSDVSVTANFFELGGDSILVVRLVARAREAGLFITQTDVFEHPVAADLALRVTDEELITPDDESVSVGPVQSTPIMHIFQDHIESIDQFSQSMLFQAPAAMTFEMLVSVMNALADCHPMLRSRLQASPDDSASWWLETQPAGSISASALIKRVDARSASPEAVQKLVDRELAEAERALRPLLGTMLRVVWLDRGEDVPGLLLLVVHHLVVDGTSWRIIQADLEEAWGAVKAGRTPTLAPEITSFRRWSHLLQAEAVTAKRQQELPFWLGSHPVAATESRTASSGSSASQRRNEHWTELQIDQTLSVLTTVPAKFHTGVSEVLLTALVLAVSHSRRGWGEADSDVPLWLESHGRNGIDGADTSRTVGCFTNMFPLRVYTDALDLAQGAAVGSAIGDALKKVKEQVRSVPGDGLGYGLLRYLDPDGAASFDGIMDPEIVWNYLGRLSVGEAEGADWMVVRRANGALQGDGTSLSGKALFINAMIEEGSAGARLRTVWSWPEGSSAESRVVHLADTWRLALELLISHCEEAEAGGHSPSDFPLIGLSQEEIDELEAGRWQR